MRGLEALPQRSVSCQQQMLRNRLNLSERHVSYGNSSDDRIPFVIFVLFNCLHLLIYFPIDLRLFQLKNYTELKVLRLFHYIFSKGSRKMRERLLVVCVVMVFAVGSVVCPPVDSRKKAEEEHANALTPNELAYGKYLEEVVKILEMDKDFIKKLENVSQDQIKSGDFAHELEFVDRRVRNKLDEVKRMELDRLRDAARQMMEMEQLGMDRKGIKIPTHLDYRNPHSFEIADLKKLMQKANEDLEEVDRKRKEEFKQYEMEKEHRYREELKKMNEEEKKAAETKHKEDIDKHKDHPRVHHPGSKQQLEQVWEEQDHMPKDEFDPNLFFAMHDLNGDNYLDEEEVEAILSLEIRKMYESNRTEDDGVEMMEEYHRMREHVYNEVDKNKDRLISKDEFIEYTKKQEFERDEGWKGLDEQQIYSEEELARYEREHYQMQGQMPPDMAQYQFAQHPQQLPPHPGSQQHYQGQYHDGQQQPQYQASHPQQQQFQGQGQPQQFQGQGQPQQYHAPPQPQFQGDVPPQYHQPQVAPAAPPHHPVHSQQVPSAPGQAPTGGDAQQKLNENKL